MSQHSDHLIGLEPVVNATCRVLIVGSFPSVISLQTGQYYANPRNDFWRIMEVVTCMPTALSYHARLSYLLSQGIGLWDVVGSCTRIGSADASIRDPEPAAIGSLLIHYPGIRTIYCNGRRAEEGLDQALMQGSDSEKRWVHIGYLPSSSPAHAVRFEEKCRSWMVLNEYINP